MQRFGEATTPSYIKEFKHGVYYGQSCRAKCAPPQEKAPGQGFLWGNGNEKVWGCYERKYKEVICGGWGVEEDG